MARYSLSVGNPTLTDRLLGRGLGVDAALIVVGVALISVAAQIVVPLWPVPMTGQIFAVLVVGAALGALRGAMATALYIVAGGLGLPIFSNGSSGFGVFLLPNGGYLIGFLFAAAGIGWVAQRGQGRSFSRALAAAAGATAIIYLIGLPWVGIARGFDFSETLKAGLYPFLLGDLIKILLFAAINAAAWKAMLKSEERERQRLVRGGF